VAGILFIVTAPSGAGKTTLVKKLLEREPGMCLSISHTTRAPRAGEQDGREYHFVDAETFLALREGGEFLEWAEVHDHHYGTSKNWLKARLDAGHDTLLEIDWQGARQVRRLFPAAVGIFILPPTLEVLGQRLRGRGTDSDVVISQRLRAARGEMRHVSEFHYVIINRTLSAALDDLVAIVRASRLRYADQQLRHAEYFAFLEQDR
jgi:guanylate kinase